MAGLVAGEVQGWWVTRSGAVGLEGGVGIGASIGQEALSHFLPVRALNPGEGF